MKELLVVALQGVLPAIGAAVLLVIVGGRRFLALAIAAGAFGAYVLLKEMPSWPHRLWTGNNDGTQWWLWSVTMAAMLATLEELRLVPRSALNPVTCLLLCCQAWLMTTNLRNSWTPLTTALHVGVGAVCLCAVASALRLVAAQRPRGTVSLAWTLCVATDAGILVLGGSALLGQLAGAVAAALGVAAATSRCRKPLVLGPSVALPLAAAHGGLLLAGYCFAELPIVALCAAALAPCALAIATARPLARRPLLGLALAVLACSVLAGIAFWSAISSRSGSASGY